MDINDTKVNSTIFITKDCLYSDINSKNPTRYRKAQLLGDKNKITKFDFEYINTLIHDSDSVLVLNPLKIVDKYTFGFEKIMNIVTPDNLEKLCWDVVSHSSWMSQSSKYRYRDAEKINAPDEALFTYLTDQAKRSFKYDNDNTRKGKSMWYTMQFLVWSKLHNVDNKEALYYKYRDEIKELMYFEIMPYWGIKTITIHEPIEGDKLTNCSDYYLERLDISMVKNFTPWIWKVIVESKYRILLLHSSTSRDAVIMIHKSLDKEDTLSKLKDSLDKCEKIKYGSYW